MERKGKSMEHETNIITISKQGKATVEQKLEP